MVLQRTKERYLGKLTSNNCLKLFFFIIKYVYLVEPTKMVGTYLHQKDKNLVPNPLGSGFGHRDHWDLQHEHDIRSSPLR